MLKQYKNLNKISEKLKKSLPKFDKIMVFELVTGRMDPNTKIMNYGGLKVIPGRDTIIDPETGEPVEIGVMRKMKGELVEKCEKFILAGGENNRVAARFELNPDVLEHHQWFYFLWLSNFRKDNPNRSRGEKALFKFVDIEAEDKVYMKGMDAIEEAFVVARNLSLEEKRIFCASMNWDSTGKQATIEAMVKRYLMANPEEFKARMHDNVEGTRTKAELKLARDKGVISLNIPDNSIVWSKSGKMICKLDRSEKEWLESFYEWVNAAKTGEEIMKQIRKAVADAVSKKMKKEEAED